MPDAPDSLSYTEPIASQVERQEIRDTWRTERADLLHRLLCLVPTTQQAEALALVLQLEERFTDTSARLQSAWYHSITAAFTAGHLLQPRRRPRHPKLKDPAREPRIH